MTTATTTAPTPRKRSKGYQPDAISHMLVEMFRSSKVMPADVRAAAQERARAAYGADPVDQDALWALLEELRTAAPSWEPPAPPKAPRPPRPAPVAPVRAPVAAAPAPAAPPVSLSLFGDPLPAPAATVPVAPAPAPVSAAATPVAAPAGLEAASRGQIQAIGQVRRCPICNRGLIPAPPAPRVCDRCGAVSAVPQLRDVPRDFLRWLERELVRRQQPAYLSRQGQFERLLSGLYHGRLIGEGHTARTIPRGVGADVCYPAALIDYNRWVADGSPTDIWGVD